MTTSVDTLLDHLDRFASAFDTADGFTHEDYDALYKRLEALQVAIYDRQWRTFRDNAPTPSPIPIQDMSAAMRKGKAHRRRPVVNHDGTVTLLPE